MKIESLKQLIIGMDRRLLELLSEPKIHKWKLTKEDDADNDSPRVLEQRVVEDAGGQRWDIEDGVY